MFYFDTSFLAPLFVTEAASDEVEAVMAGIVGESLAVSHWTRVEFSSLLARRLRMGELAATDMERIDGQFETVLRESFQIIAPSPADFDRAKAFLARPEAGLRAGDALHLAIARNHGAHAVYSLDKGMLAAGETFGISMRALA